MTSNFFRNLFLNFLSIIFIFSIKLSTIVKIITDNNIVKIEVWKYKMKDKIVELPTEYEEMIDKLEEQITKLFSEIHYYQALVTEKENTINRLTAENRYLKAQIQEVSRQITALSTPPQPKSASTYPSQKSYTPPPPIQHTTATSTFDENTRINKRVCPQCGATGFAIKEVDDRTRILSYTPQRIYAKKKVCTKCRCEFL
ncbi:MAG: hypothetical protein ACFFG0_20085 [Candidatus Thorarchaeota archaeon]